MIRENLPIAGQAARLPCTSVGAATVVRIDPDGPDRAELDAGKPEHMRVIRRGGVAALVAGFGRVPYGLPMP